MTACYDRLPSTRQQRLQDHVPKAPRGQRAGNLAKRFLSSLLRLLSFSAIETIVAFVVNYGLLFNPLTACIFSVQ